MTSCFSRKIQKTLQDASAGDRVVTKSVLKEVTHRIQNTMQALKTLPQTTRYDSNNVINLSTKSFTFYEFKLSNKNLNFCPKKQF